MEDRADPGPLRSLWARQPFRDLLIGQGISGLGDWMGTVALMALVLDLTGSSTAVGGVLVLRLAPAAVAGPVAERLSRRWDRKRTMLAMDAVRVVIVALIPLLDALWWVYLLAFLLEVAGLVFLPSRDSAVPDLAGDDHLPLANGLVLGSSYGTIPLGAGAAAAVLAITGSTSIAFWVDAATFVASFAMISRLPSLGGTQAEDGSTPAERGFRRSFSIPVVRRVSPLALLVACGLGTLFSLGIVFVREVLGADDVEFAVLVALFGVGAATGLGALHLSGTEPTLTVVQWLVVAQGLVVAGMSLSPVVGLAFVGAVLFGAATAGTLSSAMSVIQRHLVDHERVMAFNAFHVVIRAGIALAAVAGGVAADLLGPVRWPVIGTAEPARVVLVCAGLLVAGTGVAGLSAGDVLGDGVPPAGHRPRSPGAVPEDGLGDVERPAT